MLGKLCSRDTHPLMNAITVLGYFKPIAAMAAITGLLFVGAIGCGFLHEEPPQEPDFQATIATALSAAEEQNVDKEAVTSDALATAEASPTEPMPATEPPSNAHVPTASPSSPAPSPQSAIATLVNNQNQITPPTQIPTSLPSPTASPQAPVTALPLPTDTPIPQTANDPGRQRPSILFAGELMDGSTFDLNEMVGTPTLLLFWAPW